MSGSSIWASLECHCCFWIAGGLVSYLTMGLLNLQLFKNSIDTQEKLRLNLHSLSVSELLEYGRKFFTISTRGFWPPEVKIWLQRSGYIHFNGYELILLKLNTRITISNCTWLFVLFAYAVGSSLIEVWLYFNLLPTTLFMYIQVL
jgi:hypothetical protein